MSELQVTCEACEKLFNIPATDIPDPLYCPFCGERTAPSGVPVPDEPAKQEPRLKLRNAPAAEDRFKQCPECKSSWGHETLLCTNCGFNFQKGHKQSALGRNAAIVLAILLILVGGLGFLVFKKMTAGEKPTEPPPVEKPAE